MTEELKNSSQHFCAYCGQPTETYMKEGRKDPNLSNHLFFVRKVPICEPCFERFYPSKRNKECVDFWGWGLVID